MTTKLSKKELSLILSKALPTLPEEWTEWGYEQEKVEGEFLWLAGLNVDKEKTYIINVPVIHLVNHESRIEEANKSRGLEGVNDYLKRYNIGINPDAIKHIRRFGL